MSEEIMEFDYGTDAGIPAIGPILAEGAEKGDTFRRLAAKAAPFIRVKAEYEAITLDLGVLDLFASRDALGHYVGIADTAVTLLSLIAAPDSAIAAKLIYKFRRQLAKLVEAPGTNKRAHRGGPAAGAKFRGYKFIPYGENWVVAQGPAHRELTEAMGIDWHEEVDRYNETGLWSIEGQIGKACRSPIPITLVVTHRVVGLEWGLSPWTFNFNAVQVSTTHGDLDGDGGCSDTETDPDAAAELKAGPVIDGERMSWFEYQKSATLRITGKPLHEAVFGEHQTPEAKKLNVGKPVFVDPADLEAAMVGSITHQVVGIGRKFNHAFIGLCRASSNPALAKYAEWAYLAGYEVTLGGYDPLDQALIDAMYQADPEELTKLLLANGLTTEYVSEIVKADKIVRAGTNIRKYGDLPYGMTLAADELNAVWLGWMCRLMQSGTLFTPKTLVYDPELDEDVLGLPNGRKFLAKLLESQFAEAVATMDEDELPPGVAIQAARRFLVELVPVLKDYADAFVLEQEELIG